MSSCRKRLTWLCRKWDPVKFKVQTWGTSWHLCFDCVLTGWTSTMPFDWYSDWPWCPSGLICFFQPRSPTGFSKKNHHVWLENLLMVFCHLVAIIHQSHRKPEGQGHWGEVNEPNVAHPLDLVSKFDPKFFCQMVLQKSCWKKWPRKVRKKKMSNEMCRQIWVKKAYWNYVPVSQWSFHVSETWNVGYFVVLPQPHYLSHVFRYCLQNMLLRFNHTWGRLCRLLSLQLVPSILQFESAEPKQCFI